MNLLSTCLHMPTLHADDGSSLVHRTIDIPPAVASYLKTSSNEQTLRTASVRCMWWQQLRGDVIAVITAGNSICWIDVVHGLQT